MLRNVQVFEVAAVLLRSWLAKMWLPKISLSVLLPGIAIVLATFSATGVVTLLAQDFLAPPPVFFGLTLIIAHIGAMFAAVLSSVAAAQESSVMAWWRATPLSNRRLGCGLSIPVWAVAAAQAILMVPTLVVMFGQESYLNASILCCVAIVTGTIVGRVFMVVCKIACRLVSVQLANRVQIVAVVAWLLYCALSAYATQQVVTAVIVEGRTLSAWALLGFPLLVFVPASGSAWFWGLLIFWAAVLCAVEWWLWPRVGFEKYDSNTVPTLGISYLSRGSLPVFRLELARLIRCPRSQVSLVCNAITQGALMMACWVFGFNANSGFFIMVVFLNAMVASYYLVIARGLSGRNTPYALTMGSSPGRWAFAVNLSAAVLSFISTVPFLIIWALVSSDMPSLFISIPVVLFMLSSGGVVGFILMPAHDTGIVENVAMAMPFIATMTLLYFLQSFGLEEPEQASPILFTGGLVLLFVPAIIEKTRWDGANFKIFSFASFKNAASLSKALRQRKVTAK